MNTFAKTNFRNKGAVFGIKDGDRRRHMYIVGKTGMGKSTLLRNMAVNDISSGKGVCVVDPHGELALECLRAVPPSKTNEVIYFNPADLDFPVGFNILESVDPSMRHLVLSGVMSVFKRQWADSWGPRMEHYLKNAIASLLHCPNSTLLGITKIFVDQSYQSYVRKHIDDPALREFWEKEWDNKKRYWLEDVIAPIQNKAGQFASTPLIRNIVGQPRSSFNLRDVMDSRKILIINLSKGALGEDNSAMLGAMMITRLQLAAMSRVNMPESERMDFYLYVDEFQNYSTDSFASILSEARKYRLNLILAHQYIRQMVDRWDTVVKDAVFGNVGTIATFRVGAEDAKYLQDEFKPCFTSYDFTKLGKYNIYIKLMVDGVSSRPFSATTLPPIELSRNTGQFKKVIQVSRERYARRKDKVEAGINKWLGN